MLKEDETGRDGRTPGRRLTAMALLEPQMASPAGSPLLRPCQQARRSPDPLERLMAYALDWITTLVPVAAAAFSPVDRRLHAFTTGPVVMRITAERFRLQVGEAHLAYLRAFHRLDPFAPWRWADGTATVIGACDIGGREQFASSRYATTFLATYGLADQASMYLRDRGRIVAEIALLRGTDEPDIGRDELALLRRAQPLLEQAYALGRRVDAGPPPGGLSHRGLTPREIEVVCLVATGATNAEIARALYMSVATVKTHMTHVLAKLGLRSRTELVLLLRDGRPLAAPDPARLRSSRRAPAAPAAAG
jgi:DNA-binding CsgD family transcriptional regulator